MPDKTGLSNIIAAAVHGRSSTGPDQFRVPVAGDGAAALKGGHAARAGSDAGRALGASFLGGGDGRDSEGADDRGRGERGRSEPASEGAGKVNER